MEDVLSALPLLARLPEADLRALAQHATVQPAATGAILFREGDAGDALYVVAEGELRVVVSSPSGEEVTIARLGPGEACGDLSLIDGRTRSASAVAARPSRLLVVRREDFIEWLRTRPDAALALLATLSLRIRRANEALSDFAFMDVAHRLAKCLLESNAMAGSDGVVRVTQAELASMLGVSRESVNKELNNFARQGWITLGRGSVRIEDEQALRSLPSER